jgi:hypothetical protein
MINNKRGRKPKYVYSIILEGLNGRELYKKYKNTKKNDSNILNNVSPIIEYSSKNNDNTQITELTNKRKPNQLYLDTLKDNRKITMIDYINYGCLPERTDLKCYNCHHSFNTSPIGIPIEYIYKRNDKISENDKITGTNDYFLTYGITCSFPCALTFIKNNKHKSLFKKSKSLLYSLYYKIYNSELKAKKAPSYECLKVYGGHLSIDDYRKNFCSINYIITENIKRPYMVCVGKFIEENRYGFL